jgi:hypothetical protein
VEEEFEDETLGTGVPNITPSKPGTSNNGVFNYSGLYYD